MPRRPIRQGGSARIGDGKSVSEASARAADVARASYGRLLAMLAARSRDISLAEEALADAFRLALETWPKTGIPENPEAWLMATAKNRAVDSFRRISRSPVEARDELPETIEDVEDPQTIPDRRLALMFVCAHPAIDAGVHTPLMLQVVLGFEAADIGRSFLVSPAALQQRLVRAKKKIKDSRISFQLPDKADMPERITAVLEAVYGAYAMDWLVRDEARDMSNEALYLARLLAGLVPEDAEGAGLAALICIANARHPARLRNGAFVPLHEQDTERWDKALLREGSDWLRKASKRKSMGRFQLEAAIQQAHVSRVQDQVANWSHVLVLSEALCRLYPTAGAHINRIAALAEVKGAKLALDDLEAFAETLNTPFQPLEATRAHLLATLNRPADANAAYDRAISLSTEPAVRRWLAEQKLKLN
jgi:RNA polymerase sigma-70 factor, ECF subfamily